MFKNALVSVSDKTGIVELLQPLVARGMRVVSTGGTLKHLRENGISAIDVSEQTGFPEVMDGRVKTLHPRVHMALLARVDNSADGDLLRVEKLDPFDLVVVNLYPFADAVRRGVTGDELIEYIDVGGPSMLRAAAKNHHRVTVLCHPADYGLVQERGETTLAERRAFAAKVFAHTALYDDLVAKALSTDEARPDTLLGEVVSQLRYGENPQQAATWYRRNDCEQGLHKADVLHGKALSYNNILDLDAAVMCVRAFTEPAAVAVKHTNPCGVGTAEGVATAVERAILADPVSVFGGIVAVNYKLDELSADRLAKIFLECVIAPDYTPAALDRLSKKKDIRILRWPDLLASPASATREFRSIAGGFLVQTSDTPDAWREDWRIIGETPSGELHRDLLFAWRVCGSLKSNAIALVASGGTVGLGMGQVNRVDAVEQAIARMKKHHPDCRNAVLASDAFFPFADSIERIADAGVRWVIQPGGSIRDEEVIAKARSLQVNMVLTGRRHFRH